MKNFDVVVQRIQTLIVRMRDMPDSYDEKAAADLVRDDPPVFDTDDPARITVISAVELLKNG